MRSLLRAALIAALVLGLAWAGHAGLLAAARGSGGVADTARGTCGACHAR